MNAKHSTSHRFNRMIANILSILVILALAFPVTGSVYAGETTPFFRAFPDGNVVDGGNWPLDATVHMVIDDPITADFPDYEQDATVIVSPWDWIDTYVRFDFNGAYDLKQGDEVTLSADGISRYQIIPDLWVTTVDTEANIVAGTAESGTAVHVFIGGGAEMFVTSDSENLWAADFDTVEFDLHPGMSGGAEVWFDEFGDSTIFDWLVPVSPKIFAGLTDDSIRYEQTKPFASVTFSIYDTPDGNLLAEVTKSADEFGYVWISIWEHRQNLDPGTFITVTDGENTNELVVQEVSIDLADADENILAGKAPEGSSVWVVANNDHEHCGVSLEVGPGNHWEFDFDELSCDITSDVVFYAHYAQVMDADGDVSEANLGFIDGWHDETEEVGHANSCFASGFAVDSDDRERDLQIRILSDGQEVTSTSANIAWQDLVGVCGEDGSCGFDVNLWGLISTYQEHQITVQAFDLETGRWNDIGGTPRSLTCVNYDIYAFNAVTSSVERITMLDDSGEYNPTWSPNGRFIAHDVVTRNTHDIYVTNFATGKSTPLKGADGGNDAAWSPNGLWIAFDRRWADDPNLYVVPFTGGQRRLVRENAVSADWSPNGLRIVFQDLADEGKLKSVGLLGNLVIKVADHGESPAWSPDGKWIAYQKDGDIWKVRVGPLGTPLGKPIQVTSSPLVDGHPTWSADSKTIVFHSGFSSDYDLWTVPAAGGTPTWLNGAPEFGDYDPDYSNNLIAYESASPDSQAPRPWIAAYSYDVPVGTLTDGTYPYHFEFDWTLPEPGAFSGQGGEFVISSGALIHDGNILLRGPAELRGVETPEGLVCEGVDEINPNQPLRFLIGWLYGYDVFIPMAYEEARAHFDSITARAVWDDGTSAPLVRHEIFPWTPQIDWPAYVCTYSR